MPLSEINETLCSHWFFHVFIPGSFFMQNNNKYCLFSLRISRSFRYLFLSQDAFPFFVEQHFAAFCHPHRLLIYKYGGERARGVEWASEWESERGAGQGNKPPQTQNFKCRFVVWLCLAFGLLAPLKLLDTHAHTLDWFASRATKMLHLNYNFLFIFLYFCRKLLRDAHHAEKTWMAPRDYTEWIWIWRSFTTVCT